MAVAANALCSLAELKQYAGLPSGSADYDTALEALIDAVSDACESITGRELAARDQDWTFDGDGRASLFADQWPLNSITGLFVNAVEISARPNVNSNGYVFETDTGKVQLVGYVFTKGIKNCQLVCNAGYATVPGGLKQAAIEWATWKLKESGIEDVGQGLLGQASKQLPGGAGTMAFWSSGLVKDIPPQVKAHLQRFARKVVV